MDENTTDFSSKMTFGNETVLKANGTKAHESFKAKTCNKKLSLICIWITRETIGITGMSLGGFRLYFVFLKLNF